MKRGSSQIDWTISLAIFLLYLAWFFVLVVPGFEPGRELASMTESLRESTLEEISWSGFTVPLLLSSNISASQEAIIHYGSIPFVYDNASYTNSFFIHRSRLFMVEDINYGANQFYFITSDEASHDTQESLANLDANETRASVSTRSFKVEYSDSLLEKLHYDGTLRIWDASITINDIEFTRTPMYNFTYPVAAHSAYSQPANISQYVLASNSKLFLFADVNDQEKYNITAAMSVYPYGNYFAYTSKNGSLNYSVSGCEHLTTSFIDFFDTTGIAFIFSHPAYLRFCLDDEIELEINMPIRNNTFIKIVAHQGSFESAIRQTYAYSTSFGLARPIEGVSRTKIADFSANEYAALKEQWHYPGNRDFRLLIRNSTDEYLLDIGPEAPADADVFAEEYQIWLLDSQLGREAATLNIRVW